MTREKTISGAWFVLGAAVLWGTTGTAQAFAPSGYDPKVIGARPVAPSAVRDRLSRVKPRALTEPEILAILPAAAGAEELGRYRELMEGWRSDSHAIEVALDSEVEAEIQDTLYALMEGKTVIAIAHRLSTIAEMDRLIVMDEGRIIEQGTHAALLEKGGLYAKLWTRQSGGFLFAEEAAA